MLFLKSNPVVLPAIEIFYEMNGREITLEESVIPEEKETLEAISDSLQYIFRECERCRHRDSLNNWVSGII